MGDSDFCDVCGKPTNVHMGSRNGTTTNLCFNCHNKVMADLYGTDAPDNVPERLTITDRSGKPCEFDVEFIIFGTGKSLTATETGETRRKVDVWGALDDDFGEMLDTLMTRINKALSVEYMDQHGCIKEQKLVGYVDYDSDRSECVVYVDGKPYAWGELGVSVSAFQGWKIKIEFGDTGDELDNADD